MSFARRRDPCPVPVGRRPPPGSAYLRGSSRGEFLRSNNPPQVYPGYRAPYNQPQLRNPYPYSRATENCWSLGPVDPRSQPQRQQQYFQQPQYVQQQQQQFAQQQQYARQQGMAPSRPATTAFSAAPAQKVGLNQPPMPMQMSMPMSMSKPQNNTATASNNNAAANAASANAEEVDDSVKYVRLNWEDILGGGKGMEGLRVTMAPPTDKNPNRQIQFSVGDQQGPPQDGSIPLKILSFEPVENYPGQMTNRPQQNQVTGGGNGNLNQQRPKTPVPVEMMQPNVLKLAGGIAGGLSAEQQQALQMQIAQGIRAAQQQFLAGGGTPVVQTQQQQGQTQQQGQSAPMTSSGQATQARGSNNMCGNCPACQYPQQSMPTYRRR